MLAHVLLCLRANGSQVNLLLQLLPEPSQYGVIENIVAEMLDRIIICAARFEALNLRGILHHELTQFTNIVLALGLLTQEPSSRPQARSRFQNGSRNGFVGLEKRNIIPGAHSARRG